ncbi:hypothetical protein BD770DRAFT_392036 [Pilaira anomala]|nr:hypothetical protein BD770DRAFT_392036 [Pilaira anomala]
MNNDFKSSTFTWALDTTATSTKKQEEPFGLSDADLFQFLLGEEEGVVVVEQPATNSSCSSLSDIVMMEKKSPMKKRTAKKEVNHKPVTTSTTSRLDFRPMNDSIPESQLKSMTSKERRQLRNKISARNFRNRRKEYVGTLEEQLSDSKNENNQLLHELKWAKEKIERLEKENDKLRLDLMLGGMILPAAAAVNNTTSPTNNYPSLVHSSLNFSSGSSDESNLSSPPNLFMDFPDNWDFVLPQDTTTTTTTTNFQDSYIASAVVPDWNINHVLSKETSLVSTTNHQLLLRQYPLLAPALMSIVIAHTMAMSTDELLATSKLNTTTTVDEPLLKDNFFIDKPAAAAAAAGVMSDKEAKAVWSILEPLTLLNERNAKIAGDSEGTVTTTTDTTSSSECRTKICEFYETKVIPYCPIAWFQSRICKSVCEYVASNCIWNNNNNTPEEPKSIKPKPLICRQFHKAKRYITTCE